MKRVLDDLTIFCAVVETGSLKQASLKLSIPHSTVSRRIEALENNLGLTLLYRSTREVQVTARGQALYEDCSQSLANIRASVATAIDDEVQFRGQLNVSMPVRAGIDFLGGWLIDFAASHIDLKLDVALSNTNKNLIRDDIDLAFRVGPLVDSSAIALHLWDIPYVICCHRHYFQRHQLHDVVLDAKQIQSLPAVVTKPAVTWTFAVEHNKEIQLQPNAALHVDDLGLAYHAVKSGQYIGLLPEVMIEQEDEVVVLPLQNLRPRTRKMYAYYLGRRHSQSQIKNLIEYVKARYQQNQSERAN